MNPEDNLQIQVINYLRYQYGKALFCHVPNGGKRNAIEGAKFKRMGVLAGVPDILIFNKNYSFDGLAIELKIKPNKPTKIQLEVIERFKEVGFDVHVCYDFDSCKNIIDNYFKTVVF